MNKHLFDVLDRIRYVINQKPNLVNSVMDSYRKNQYDSKIHLVSTIKSLGIFDRIDNVVVLACWYGTILFPLLLKHCESIIGYDIDRNCYNLNKARPIDKCIIETKDIWLHDLPGLYDAELIINTSCEHMLPMNHWPRWDIVLPGTYVAFQSNDMFYVDDHINCVNNIDEFISQMPSNLNILSATEIDMWDSKKQNSNYKRFTIIGQT